MHSCFFSLFGYNLLIRIKSKFLPIAFFFFQLVQSHLLKPLSSHCLLSPPHLLLLKGRFYSSFPRVRKIPLEKGMATHSSILVWEDSVDRGAW